MPLKKQSALARAIANSRVNVEIVQARTLRSVKPGDFVGLVARGTKLRVARKKDNFCGVALCSARPGGFTYVQTHGCVVIGGTR